MKQIVCFLDYFYWYLNRTITTFSTVSTISFQGIHDFTTSSPGHNEETSVDYHGVEYINVKEEPCIDMKQGLYINVKEELAVETETRDDKLQISELNVAKEKVG